MLAENPRMPGQTNQRLLARLDLLDAETHWLLSDFEHAATRGALAVFTACDDAAGCADAHDIWRRCISAGAIYRSVTNA